MEIVHGRLHVIVAQRTGETESVVGSWRWQS